MSSILETQHLTKRLGSLDILQDISFSVHENEVVGITGLSGSGKTTLVNLIGGLAAPNGGIIRLRGTPLVYPFDASRKGVEIIHQVPSLVDSLDIVANVFLGYRPPLGLLPGWLRMPNRAQMERAALNVLAELNMQYESLNDLALQLTHEQRQLISIARAMVRPSDVLLIDEPTAMLSYEHQQQFLSLVQSWQGQGKTILFCSTNLDHLFAVTDRILVLQHGQDLVSFRTDETNREEIVAAMVGQGSHKQLTPAIWALDRYYRAREEADRLYQQTSLLAQDTALPETLNQQLLAQLALQVKALDQANAALQNAQRRLLTEREQERKHLARELHDQVIQDLLSTTYQLDTLAHQGTAPADFNQQLIDMQQSVKQLVEEVRRICGNLRPPTIDSLGLRAAIQSHTNNWSARTGIQVTLNLDMRRLPEEVELSVFRIIQEGLNNVYYHSDATQVQIAIYHTSPRSLMIALEDDGRGLPEDFDLSQLAAQGHYGLLGISERVALLSGHLKLTNRSVGGMLLQAEIPHSRIETAEGEEIR